MDGRLEKGVWRKQTIFSAPSSLKMLLFIFLLLAPLPCQSIPAEETKILMDLILDKFEKGETGLDELVLLGPRMKRAIKAHGGNTDSEYPAQFFKKTVAYISMVEGLKKNRNYIPVPSPPSFLKNWKNRADQTFEKELASYVNDWKKAHAYQPGELPDLALAFQLFSILENYSSIKPITGIDRNYETVADLSTEAIARLEKSDWDRFPYYAKAKFETLCGINLKFGKTGAEFEENLKRLRTTLAKSDEPTWVISFCPLLLELEGYEISGNPDLVSRDFEKRKSTLFQEYNGNHEHVCLLLFYGHIVARSYQIQKNVGGTLDALRFILHGVLLKRKIMPDDSAELLSPLAILFRKILLANNKLEEMRQHDCIFALACNLRPLPRQETEVGLDFDPPIDLDPRLQAAADLGVRLLSSPESWEILSNWDADLKAIIQGCSSPGFGNESNRFLISKILEVMARLKETKCDPAKSAKLKIVLQLLEQTTSKPINGVPNLKELQTIMVSREEAMVLIRELFGPNSVLEIILLNECVASMELSIPCCFLSCKELLNFSKLDAHYSYFRASGWNGNCWFERERSKILAIVALQDKMDPAFTKKLIDAYEKMKMVSNQSILGQDVYLHYFRLANSYQAGRIEDCKSQIRFDFSVSGIELFLGLKALKLKSEILLGENDMLGYIQHSEYLLDFLTMFNQPDAYFHKKLFEETSDSMHVYFLRQGDSKSIDNLAKMRKKYFKN